MNKHPFGEVAANAEEKIQGGWTIFQQFECAGCKVKQTMEQPNSFYTLGICEECGVTTDIVSEGCNFMAMSAPTAGGELTARLQEVIDA